MTRRKRLSGLGSDPRNRLKALLNGPETNAIAGLEAPFQARNGGSNEEMRGRRLARQALSCYLRASTAVATLPGDRERVLALAPAGSELHVTLTRDGVDTWGQSRL